MLRITSKQNTNAQYTGGFPDQPLHGLQHATLGLAGATHRESCVTSDRLKGSETAGIVTDTAEDQSHARIIDQTKVQIGLPN